MRYPIRQLKLFLKKHKRFLVTSHINPEGDSLGSELALACVLKKMKKQYEIINHDLCSREYLFLPGITQVRRHPKNKNFDAVIVLDCSDLSRIGSVVNYIQEGVPILNIDHHISNNNFGAINIVDASASSTCEFLYTIFEQLGAAFDKTIATNLFTGIVVDTGSFRYTNTRASTHRIAAQLRLYNVDVQAIHRNIYANLLLTDLRCIVETLLGVKKDTLYRIAWVSISHKLIKRYKPTVDLTDNILGFIRSLEGVDICLLFKERLDRCNHVRVNLRSNGKVDVNRIASHFGGGGHKTASGITLNGVSLGEAEKKILSYVRKTLKGR